MVTWVVRVFKFGYFHLKSLLMKKLNLLFIALFSAMALSCTQAPKTATEKAPVRFDFVKTFEGIIGDDYAVHLKITSDNGSLKGVYFYDNVGAEIGIDGSIESDSTVVIREYDETGNQTGLWKGRLESENKISGTWSKPNGSSPQPFSLIATSRSYKEAMAAATEPEDLIRVGMHNLTLQWISWEKPGSVEITKIDENTYRVLGEQIGEYGDNFLTVDGILRPVSEKELIFDGTIKTRVSHVNGGETCIRNGKQIFESTKGRKYWRMQNMANCEGGASVDYIDIYF